MNNSFEKKKKKNLVLVPYKKIDNDFNNFEQHFREKISEK